MQKCVIPTPSVVLKPFPKRGEKQNDSNSGASEFGLVLLVTDQF